MRKGLSVSERRPPNHGRPWSSFWTALWSTEMGENAESLQALWSARWRRLGLMAAIAVLLWLVLPAALRAAESEDDLNYLEIAAMLTRDGKYDRAATELAKVDQTRKDFDPIKFHTVGGLIALNRQEPKLAIEAFGAAIAAGQIDPTIYLYLAQAQFGLQRYRDTLKTLETAGPTVENLGPVWLMRAQCHWLLEEHQTALNVLSEGAARFPKNLSFARRQVFFLIELGYYQAAALRGEQYLRDGTDATEEDYLAIGSALRRAKEPEAAAGFLEQARLRFGDSENLSKQLAAVYLDLGQPLAAADLIDRYAMVNPALKAEAAELYRRAGLKGRALARNAEVVDQKVKLKQRLGILLELRRYAEVRAMRPALVRTGLIEDEDVRYALAFAQYQAGDFEASEAELKKLTKPELFRKATELRKLMADCAQERWKCV